MQIEDQFKLRLPPTMGREVTGRPSEADQLGQLTRPFQLSVWAMSGIIGTHRLWERRTRFDCRKMGAAIGSMC